MSEIEIFKKGTHVSASGEKLSFGDRELDEIVETYDPQHFRAPLIITHNTFGVPDHKLADYSADDGELPTSKRLAFGFPEKLKRVGDAIVGVFNKISPKFEKLNREGAILAISSSLYRPTSPANPYPGKWALRHVAGLGAEAPAVKGMTPLSLSELPSADLGDEFAIAFSEEEGVVDFASVDFGTWTWNAVGDAFRGMREWIIENWDSETADRVLPSSLIGILQQESGMPDPLQWELNSLRERIARLEGANEINEGYSMTEEQTQDFTEREAKITQREQAIAQREAELRKAEFIQFCETELKDRLTPAIASTDEVVAFMEHLQASEPVAFSDANTQAPLDWFKGFLKKIPPQVFYDRLPGDEPNPAPSFSAPDSADFDEDSRKLDAEIRSYMATQKSKHGRELTYSEATDEVLAARR